MPKFLEDKLSAEYGNNAHAIYGTMNKLGAMHGNKETAKGRQMEKKHEAKMHNVHRIEIEVHRGPAKQVTGHTVHTTMAPKAAGKSGAFMEQERSSQPFGVGQHKQMMSHISEQLGGGQAEDHAAKVEKDVAAVDDGRDES